MKIIEEGHLPEKRIHRARCTHCRTLVEFERGEGRVYSGTMNDSFLIVQCPMCKGEIYADFEASRVKVESEVGR